jgi:hypothetical protein
MKYYRTGHADSDFDQLKWLAETESRYGISSYHFTACQSKKGKVDRNAERPIVHWRDQI